MRALRERAARSSVSASRFPVRASLDGAVLLGGASSRMGTDKATLEFAGLPSVEHVARAVARVCETLYLVGGAPPETTRGHRIPDPEGPQCALRGLVAALDASRAEYVLVLATDLPLVTPDLLRALAVAPEAAAVVPRDEGGIHPLCARYRREPVLSAAAARLASGSLALRGVLEDVGFHPLEGDALRAADPEGRALWNVNRPEEARKAAGWLEERAQRSG